jgi:hypothetical protein
LLIFGIMRKNDRSQQPNTPPFWTNGIWCVLLSFLVFVAIGISTLSTFAWTGEYWWATPKIHRAWVNSLIQQTDRFFTDHCCMR